ncbi:unnamed protein product, partial [Mesorhabditis spiculigera]
MGRAGVLLMLRLGMNCIDAGKPYEPEMLNWLKFVRSQRANSVQLHEQWLMCHFYLAYYRLLVTGPLVTEPQKLEDAQNRIMKYYKTHCMQRWW